MVCADVHRSFFTQMVFLRRSFFTQMFFYAEVFLHTPHMACTRCGVAAIHHCAACKAPYCTAACQRADWKQHKLTCSTCSICFEHGATPSGCACRGDANLAHVACLDTAAQFRYTDTGSTDGWSGCAVCKQKYSGNTGIGLAIRFFTYAQDIPIVNIEAVCHLASANLSVNEHTKALRLYNIALSKLLPLYGPEDKWVITVMNGKARALEQSGQHIEAAKLYLQSSEVAHRTLGPEDRTTLLLDCNLASSLQAVGKHAEAEVLFRNVLAIEERLYGRDDSSTLCTMNNLGMILKGEEGRALLKEVHTRCLRVMGPTHPFTLAVASNLGI